MFSSYTVLGQLNTSALAAQSVSLHSINVFPSYTVLGQPITFTLKLLSHLWHSLHFEYLRYLARLKRILSHTFFCPVRHLNCTKNPSYVIFIRISILSPLRFASHTVLAQWINASHIFPLLTVLSHSHRLFHLLSRQLS